MEHETALDELMNHLLDQFNGYFERLESDSQRKAALNKLFEFAMRINQVGVNQMGTSTPVDPPRTTTVDPNGRTNGGVGKSTKVNCPRCNRSLTLS